MQFICISFPRGELIFPDVFTHYHLPKCLHHTYGDLPTPAPPPHPPTPTPPTHPSILPQHIHHTHLLQYLPYTYPPQYLLHALLSLTVPVYLMRASYSINIHRSVKMGLIFHHSTEIIELFSDFVIEYDTLH